MMAATVGFSSCDSYLDKLPDNRMELSSPDDVSKVLTLMCRQCICWRCIRTTLTSITTLLGQH